MKSLCITATASNQGKTILTTALLHYFKSSVRAYKIGPDYIDPQFHQKITGSASINLDTFIMNHNQVEWIYQKYSDKNISIAEGVMGFYDGMDKGCSAYDVSKLLNIPTILLLDGSGSYITVSAVLKGLKEYKKDNTIRAVVVNKLSSSMHYKLIKKQIEKDFEDIIVLGWIKKDLEILKNTHLGLDLKEMKKIESISKSVLEYIDIRKLEEISQTDNIKKIDYPFENIPKVDKKLAIVKDSNFSFLYHDNIVFLQEIFEKVYFVDATKDEKIPKDSDILYLPGGYVETDESYQKIKNSHKFKTSLLSHAKTKPIYAECAGLLYLSNRVDKKIMSGVLDIDFTLQKKRERLGYYYNNRGVKGHAFHYTKSINPHNGVDILSKKPNGSGKIGSWQKDKIFGTYLHTMFRSNTSIIKEYFIS
jgi:cobyrinic acid a,c-diamide synthase